MVLGQGDVHVDRDLVKRLLGRDLVEEAEKAPHFWYAWWHQMSVVQKYEYAMRVSRQLEPFVCTECYQTQTHQSWRTRCPHGYAAPGEHNWVRSSRWYEDELRKLEVEHVLMGWHQPQTCKHCHRSL